MSVYITSEESSKEAAALGGAFLGKWAWWKGQEGNQDRSYEEMIHEKKSGATEHILVATPNPENAKVYEGILDAYRKAEQLVVERSQ
jgi:xylulokinase